MDEPAIQSFLAGLARRGAPWGDPPPHARPNTSDVVLSSRVRMARNISGIPFLGKASRDQRAQVVAAVRSRLSALEVGHAANSIAFLDIVPLAPLDRALLMERHLISKEHAKGDLPRAVAISTPDERLSIMVNEEDHLRLRAMRPALDLAGALAHVSQADDLLECADSPTGIPPVTYAYHPRFGYLTACPTNVGTGIRASVLLHLPALTMTGEMEKVRRATKDLGLAVRGSYGEGTEAAGDLYQVSNQTTLGKTERLIIEDLERRIIPQIIEYERQARKLLFERRRRIVEDRCMRSLGILQNARLMTPEEAIALLSHVRLGVLGGIISNINETLISDLVFLVQPAHLQRHFGVELDQNARREARADLLRTLLRRNSETAGNNHPNENT